MTSPVAHTHLNLNTPSTPVTVSSRATRSTRTTRSAPSAPAKPKAAPAPAELLDEELSEELDDNIPVEALDEDFLTTDELDEVEKDSAGGAFIAVSKLPEGKLNRFRVFGRGITGKEGWVEEGEKSLPVRWRVLPDEFPANIKTNAAGKPDIKRFVAALVWDYQNERFSVLQMTPKSLLGDMNQLIKDPDFGNIHDYDIKILRTGSGLETKYKMTGGRCVDPAPEIVEAYNDLYYNLENLFEGDDPFAAPADGDETFPDAD